MAFVLFALVAQTGHAQVDAQTQDLLIDKLTRVYLGLPAGDPSRNSIVLRLADLHAERARQATMKDLNSGCTTCEAGQADRKKAIRYYEETMPKLSKEAQSKVLIQLGHMHEVMGNEGQAISAYQRVIETAGNPAMTSEAHLSLAEIYFKKSKFEQANKEYKEVLRLGGSKGLAAYRSAWCEFNLGHIEQGAQILSMMLKSPEYLNRTASASTVSIDKQFQEEVSRDLATFMVKSSGTRNVASLYELSPETTRLDNVFYLASEMERLGQNGPATEAWKFLLEKENRPAKKLAIHMHLAQNQLDAKNFPPAIQEFDMSLALWQATHCEQDKECSELKTRLRKFVTDFHKMEKKNPSEGLLTVYQRYLEVFPQDVDMRLWSGEVAKERKQYKEATAAFSQAAKQALQEREALTEAKARQEKATFAENALLSAIETAELSQDAALQAQTQDQYLAMSVEKKKAFEVQYQRAHLLYEKNNYQAASVALRELALNPKGPPEMRKKAADLAMDSLSLLKDDKTIGLWSADFAKAFPQQAGDFKALSRQSVLKQSVQTEDANASWAILAGYDVADATPQERITYYKNKLILAEKRQDFSEARLAADQLLQQPNLTSADKEFALSRKAYLAELTLDFSSALQALTAMKPTEDKTLLKMGMYASLAQKDPKPFYREYLVKEAKADDATAVAAMLVRESADGLAEINKNKAILSKNPELLAQLYLEVSAKAHKAEISKLVLNDSKLAATNAGKVLVRSQLLADYSVLKSKFAQSKMDGSTQKKMASSLKGRTQLLEQADKQASQAIAKADWSSQLLSLDLLAKESRRFYEEILSLPVPAGLTPEEEQTYLNLISQQAAPHKQRADDVDRKVSEFWAQNDSIEKLKQSYEKTDANLQMYSIEEVTLLKERAPDAIKAQMQSWSLPQAKVAGLTVAEVEKARAAVREKPMDKARIESLLDVEKRMGHVQMVQYLESRLLSMNETTGGKTL